MRANMIKDTFEWELSTPWDSVDAAMSPISTLTIFGVMFCRQGAKSFTRTGVVLGVVVRVPSSPMSFPPQQYALPSVATPHV
jgi:hypothetical protein